MNKYDALYYYYLSANVSLQEDPSLSLQHRADSGSSNSLQEAVLHVDDAGLSPSRPAYDEVNWFPVRLSCRAFQVHYYYLAILSCALWLIFRGCLDDTD